jgi:hypothetical protein
VFNIPIQSMRLALSPTLGDRGARELIVSDLSRGILQSQCKTFTGLHASRLLGAQLPDQGEDLVLPTAFWSGRFIDEGEQHFSTQGMSLNYRADWPAGNFALSGTIASGRDPFARSAFDVHLDRTSAMARLVALNIDAASLKAIPAIPETEILAWLVRQLRMRPMSQNAAEKAIEAQFPGSVTRPLKRSLFVQAQAQVAAPT